MLRDAPLGTMTGARWRVTAWRKQPARFGSSVAEVRSSNALAPFHDAELLREWKRHARQHTDLQCRRCGEWVRVVEEANADRIIATHLRTKRCAVRGTRRDLVWQGFMPGYTDSKLESERATALEARRYTDGVWVSIERQVREWRLSHDRNPLTAGPVSWAALEDDGDELRDLATTWSHHLCLEDTYCLGSRSNIRGFFMNLWFQYLCDTRPQVKRTWAITPGTVSAGLLGILPVDTDYAEFNTIMRDATIAGVVFVGSKFELKPGAGIGYRAVRSPHEEQLYKKLTDFLMRPVTIART